MLDDQNVIILDTDISAKIDSAVEHILDAEDYDLPTAKSDLVQDYIKKIEGTYSVDGAKEDTDNAVHLLTIAYNTTPVEEGGIRNEVDKIRNRLVKLQQRSALGMEKAVTFSTRVQEDMAQIFIDWKTARNKPGSEDFIGILTEDVNDLTDHMAEAARDIQTTLTEIANDYDDVIVDLENIIATAQTTLATRVNEKDRLLKDMREAEAKKAQLESMVKDLKDDIEAFERRAAKYETLAQSAEARAFFTSIIQVGAQMVSSSIPAITAALTGAATGGTSLIASNAMSSLRQITDFSAAESDDDKTEDVLKAKREIAEKTTEKNVADNNTKKLSKTLEALRAEKEELELDTDADNTYKIEAIQQRILNTEEELSEEQTKSSNAAVAVESLKEVLRGIDENMGRMSEEQQKQAGNLRQMQMNMMDKIEAYQKAKREQAGELANVTALLIGQRTEEETLELTIKSLSLCLSALKRAKEIIVEIAAFFHNFEAYMGNIAVDADTEAAKIKAATECDPPKARYLRRVARRTDNFFVMQAAQWHAVSNVSERFKKTFEHGWTTLSDLQADYLHGDALVAYLARAGKEIDKIVAARRERADARILELEKYRARLDAVTVND